ncbi:MAG: hypothetical protein CL609_08375 [Anaerolineaceae bacterium]|nr:hypothetical protein [Anaerolineaceae bacterium]
MNYFQKDIVLYLENLFLCHGYSQTGKFTNKDYMFSFQKELDKDIVCEFVFQCSKNFQKKDNYQFNINIKRFNKNIHSKVYQNLNGRLNHFLSITFGLEKYKNIIWWNFIRNGDNQGIYKEIELLLEEYIFPWLENPHSRGFGRLSFEEESDFKEIIKKHTQHIMNKNGFVYKSDEETNCIVYIKKLNELITSEIRFSFGLNLRMSKKEFKVLLTQITVNDENKKLSPKSLPLKELMYFENEITIEQLDQKWFFNKKADLIKILTKINPFIEKCALDWLCNTNSPSYMDYMRKINPTVE